MQLEQDSGKGITQSATHTRRSVKEFDELWSDVLDLADLVHRALNASIRALCVDDTDATELAAEVKSAEKEVDRREVCIERTCLRVLALYEPVAIDLRRVATALRVNGQLERIGDSAARIAKRAKKQRAIAIPQGLRDLAGMVVEQVDQSLALLASPDADRARAVIDADCALDREYRAFRTEIKQSIRQEPERVSDWLRFIDTARNLERIGDHAVSIAEAVIYLKDGGYTRHEGRRSSRA